MDYIWPVFKHLFQNHWFDPVIPELQLQDNSIPLKSLNAAFLISLAGKDHPDYATARECMQSDQNPRSITRFYQNALQWIESELTQLMHTDTDFESRLAQLEEWCSLETNLKKVDQTQELIWSVFFPEGERIRGQIEQRIDELRRKRRIHIDSARHTASLNSANEILFTSNVLLTLPLDSSGLNPEHFPHRLSNEIQKISNERQKYWYDHPIPIGISLEKNEFVYGLRALDNALQFEKQRGLLDNDHKVICVLSASVTHTGLQPIVREYIDHELKRAGGLKHLDVYIFTEQDCNEIKRKILDPAVDHFSPDEEKDRFFMFGVDGEYGRHYSFLKAISAFWQVFIDSRIEATFKIDLDQVFPQAELIQETSKSMLEHLQSELWGMGGTDDHGQRFDLGMIAGALVNQEDIGKSIFTPDVTFPDRSPVADESIFMSQLPQALSTTAEMMTRYDRGDIVDGINTCLQRVHVTGGTNGIRVDSLFRHKPFTPSFIGRAEDQAYIMSTLNHSSEQLAYLHQPGLMMRHDKHSFAEEAIQAASIGKIIGDYTRTILFTHYAKILSDDITKVKKRLDPFSGCFISKCPLTVVFLRLALRAGLLFSKGNAADARELINQAERRLPSVIYMVNGSPSKMERQYKREKKGWLLYYSLLTKMNMALQTANPVAVKLKNDAKTIVKGCRLSY